MSRSIVIIYRINLILVLFIYYLKFSESSMVRSLVEKYPEEDIYFYSDIKASFKLEEVLERVGDRLAYLDISRLITFYLLTRHNPEESQIIRLGDNDSLLKTNFEIDKTTVFLSHGWLSEAKDMKYIANELLADDDVNVINVDWSPIAKNEYITAKSKTTETGEAVGDFVNWLVTCGVSYNRVHLVGISLGAQLVGSAGRRTGGKVIKITGLDPAGPLWYTDTRRLQPTDAQYVEVIHTNTLFYGYKYPCGDVDFYPDGGAIMSACQSSVAKNLCSHVMSMHFFIVSLRYANHFVANQCSSYAEATEQPCDGQFYVFGTSDLTKSGMGIYRMETEPDYPY